MRRKPNIRALGRGQVVGYQRDLLTNRYRAVRLPEPDEREIQIAVIEHVRLRARPGVLCWHCPNGGFRTKAEASLLRAMGVLAGVADLQVTFPPIVNDAGNRIAAPVLFLELKARGRTLRPDQKHFGDLVRAQGHIFEVADTLDDALRILKQHEAIQ